VTDQERLAVLEALGLEYRRVGSRKHLFYLNGKPYTMPHVDYETALYWAWCYAERGWLISHDD
jgi:hypothetical protein